ncbi:hypothetical protein [Alteromonas sp. 14N.309.X.WAT.G.H12]|uniref:hypothetical protein n=1 Tax=Alteromonas sp. 14N.309.X.WAT.G.H12 TaxID=3120824 RepID=UPI002FD3B49A
MNSTYSQDTSSQAMTEVALGLSMAFFAILIVALLSTSASHQPPEIQSQEIKPMTLPDTSLSLGSATSNAKATGDAQFIFYHDGKLLDQTLREVVVETLDPASPVYLAVPPDLALANIIKTQQQINHPKLFITLIDHAWQIRLEQQP